MRDLLVDLSNACRDQRLGGNGAADWRRLDRLLDTWKRDINPDSDFYFVADDNLAGFFRSDEDRARWRALKTKGNLTSVGKADPVLLDIAFQTGASVLSCDRFLGHRRQFPWVDKDQQHFWDWAKTDDGNVAIRRRAMGHFPSADLTQAEESDARKAQGLSDQDPLLDSLWRCRTHDCKYAHKPAVTRMPVKASEQATCPVCHGVLINLGPRPKARKLKLIDSQGRTLHTKNLAEGQNVVVGRGPNINTWDLSLFVPSNRLSRQHARLEVRAGQVVVTDLSSKNGTRIANWNPSAQEWLPPEAIQSPTTLRARDRIELPGGLRIEQSGARYVVPEFL